jgi:hypothetical protein
MVKGVITVRQRSGASDAVQQLSIMPHPRVSARTSARNYQLCYSLLASSKAFIYLAYHSRYFDASEIHKTTERPYRLSLV